MPARPAAHLPSTAHITHGRNDSGETAPALAILEIIGAIDGQRAVILGKPSKAGITRFVITPKALASTAAPGRVISYGIAHVIVDTGGATLAVGDCICPTRNSWHAQPIHKGPMLVTKILATDGDLVTVRVTITGQRCDNHMVTNSDDSVQAIAQTLRIGHGATLAQTAFGATTVTETP